MKHVTVPAMCSWILMTVLLVVVWRNSHWSVALSLTLIGIATELNSLAIRIHATASKEMLSVILDKRL
jgi:hypothetical protein